jgi:hypothetical protein
MISSRGLAVLGLDVQWVPRGAATSGQAAAPAIDEGSVARIHIRGPWPNPGLRRLLENMMSLGLGDQGLPLDWATGESGAQGIEIVVALDADQRLHAGLPNADQILSAHGKREAWSALCALRREMREALAGPPLQS